IEHRRDARPRPVFIAHQADNETDEVIEQTLKVVLPALVEPHEVVEVYVMAGIAARRPDTITAGMLYIVASNQAPRSVVRRGVDSFRQPYVFPCICWAGAGIVVHPKNGDGVGDIR